MAVRFFILLLIFAQFPVLPRVFADDVNGNACDGVSMPAMDDQEAAIELEVEEDDLHVSCSRGCMNLLIHADFHTTLIVLPGMPLRVDELYSRPPPGC